MFFTKATIRLTISTDGSGATVAGIMLTSLSVCFESSVTFLRRVSFILVLSIIIQLINKTIFLQSLVLIAKATWEEYANCCAFTLNRMYRNLTIQGFNNGLTDAETQA